MAKTLKQSDVTQALKTHGALLVFPIKNKKKPDSIWSVFYPRSIMRWEWDDSGDNRVVQLWHLRAELATSRRVVYSKWFQGRATVFNRKLLPALLRVLNDSTEGFDMDRLTSLSEAATQALQLLEDNSPISTKQLKAEMNLKGSSNAAAYDRMLKELFARFLVVGVGEIDDGAFPSLAMGATKLCFDKEWEAASKLGYDEAFEGLEEALGEDNLFFKEIKRYQKKYLYQKATQSSKNKAPSEISWGDL